MDNTDFTEYFEPTDLVLYINEEGEAYILTEKVMEKINENSLGS